ncbi:MAG TPA: hypothetical protein VFZ00_05950 [Solirubrobacter sp.]|nr:hypothetical protein [Solirubrobacter sp.]
MNTLLLAAGLAASLVGTEPVGPPGVRVHYVDEHLYDTGSTRPGPLRLTLTGSQTTSIAIVELDPGRTTAELTDLDSADRVGRVVAGATVRAGRTYRTTIVARRDLIALAANGAKTRLRLNGTRVTVPPPRAAARIVVSDDDLRVPGRLPTHGVIRVDNAGTHPHRVVAVRLGTGAVTELVGPVSAGTTNRVHVRLRPGRYRVIADGSATARTRVR